MTSVGTASKRLKDDEDDEKSEHDIYMIIHLQKPVLQENVKYVKKKQVLYRISF